MIHVAMLKHNKYEYSLCYIIGREREREIYRGYREFKNIDI